MINLDSKQRKRTHEILHSLLHRATSDLVLKIRQLIYRLRDLLDRFLDVICSI
jgi:hypothetical protein